MRKLAVHLVLAFVILASTPVGADDESSRVVIGPSNPNLFDGAAALIAGDPETGVRLTHLGLSMATNRRERLVGLSNLCAGYLLLEQLDVALDFCNQALEINDRHWRSYSNRALIYLKLKRYEEAEQDLERGLTIAPDSAKLKTVRAQLLDEIDPVSPRITIDERRGEPDQ
ncbi:MAG: tetratricopeptide repeat protein [Woeseiaceae bacterium]|nr:tetratricopeptide repeat protein [Woeseiaceae bacterium]